MVKTERKWGLQALAHGLICPLHVLNNLKNQLDFPASAALLCLLGPGSFQWMVLWLSCSVTVTRQALWSPAYLAPTRKQSDISISITTVRPQGHKGCWGVWKLRHAFYTCQPLKPAFAISLLFPHVGELRDARNTQHRTSNKSSHI